MDTSIPTSRLAAHEEGRRQRQRCPLMPVHSLCPRQPHALTHSSPSAHSSSCPPSPSHRRRDQEGEGRPLACPSTQMPRRDVFFTTVVLLLLHLCYGRVTAVESATEGLAQLRERYESCVRQFGKVRLGMGGGVGGGARSRRSRRRFRLHLGQDKTSTLSPPPILPLYPSFSNR